MHNVATRISSHAILSVRHFAAVGVLLAWLSTSANAGELDGVQFVDDLEQSLQKQSASTQGSAYARPNGSNRSPALRPSPTKRNAPRYLPNLGSEPQASTSPNEKPKSWRSKFSFKNPLAKLWGGPTNDSPSAPSANQTATNNPSVRSSTGYLNPVYQKRNASSSPSLSEQAPNVQQVAQNRPTNRGGIQTRSTAPNDRPRGLFSLGQKNTAQATSEREQEAQPVAPSPKGQLAQKNSDAPRWTGQSSLSLATKTPKEPSFNGDQGFAMISDRDDLPTMKTKPRAASNFSRGPNNSSRVAVSPSKRDLQKLRDLQRIPEVVGPPRRPPSVSAAEPTQTADNRATQAAPVQVAAATPPLPTGSAPQAIVNRHVTPASRNYATRIPSGPLPVGRPIRPANATDQQMRSQSIVPLGVSVADRARPAKRPTHLATAMNPAAVRPSAPVPSTPRTEQVSEPTPKGVELLAKANRMSQAASSEEEYTAIIQTCRQVLAIDSSPTAVKYSKQLASWALNRRGELKADEGRTTEASIDYEDALRFDPKRWRAIHNRGVMAAHAGRYADAFDDFNQTLKINPNFAKAYSNRATLYAEAGQLAKARADYQRAIRNDPDLAVAHKGCGRVCHKLGELDSALQHFDAAALLAPADAKIVNLRGDLLTDMGRYRNAAANYRQAIELDNQLASAYRNLAWLQATCPDKECRDTQLALANAERAIALNPKPNDLDYDTLGAAQAASGDFELAKASVDRALELAKESDKANYLWRRGLYEQGQPYVTEPASDIQQASYAN